MASRLVVQCGLPGVGKSTVAAAIADRIGGERIRSDVVRAELFDEPAYTPAEKDRVYATMLERAQRALETGTPAVVDATYEYRRHRDQVVTMADTLGVDLTLVHVVCDERVARKRIREREDDPSEADVSVYENARDRFEPLERDHLTVDNSGSLARTREQVQEHF